MAAKTNGRPAASGSKAANGNAVLKTQAPRTAKKAKAKSSWLSTILRLATWYSIFVVLFQCPASLDQVTDASPRVCKPYFRLRAQVLPHVAPYYDRYAAPYVDAAKPFYNALNKTVITPATALGKEYGGPRVAQAQTYAQAQWEKRIQPEVLKYQAIAKKQYDQSLAPHLNKATAATVPYFNKAKANALQAYHGSILPTYNAVQPYALQSYDLAHNFVVDTGIPYTKLAWTTGGVFLNRTVFPRVRILYGENVEPQLVRIGERLGRYRGGKKLKSVIEEINSSSASAPAPSSASVKTTTLSASATSTASVVVEQTPQPDIPAPVPMTEAENIANAQTIIQKDLRVWQEKFAKAADEGSDEIEERIAEITTRLIKNQAEKVGPALIIELEETVKSSLAGLKSSLISIVKSNKDAEEAEEDIATAVRKAGVAIREKGQAVRTWKQSFDAETGNLISASVKDTFDILDHISDLGLTEIGMRWAWIEGVTHKDWAKYHALKKKFAEWRMDVEQVVLEHPGIAKTTTASAKVENKAMDIAEQAAKELARLKEVGVYKFATKDDSDDFTTRILPAAAANAGQKVLDKVSEASEAIVGTSQGTVESASSVAAASIADAVSSASSLASEAVDGVTSIVADVGETAGSVASVVSSSVIGTQGTVESIASVAKESASSLSSQAFQAVLGEEPGFLEKATSSAGSLASGISTAASSSFSSASSDAAKSVWGGAMAQHVEAKQIIFEDVIEDSSDEDTFSEKIQEMVGQAGTKFADVTKAVSEALLQPTSTPGSVESITSLAADQYSSALAAASSVLYGTEQGTGESIASVASSRYSEAVSAARAAIYGTPVPMSESVLSQAKAVYEEAVAKASESYSLAKSHVSVQVSGTPKPVYEQAYSSAESAYSEAIENASSRYQAVASAASTAVYGPPPGAVESIQSVAALKLAEGLSAASAQYESAKSFIGATPTPVAEKLAHQAQIQYYAGIGMAHARYSEFLSAVLPTQTPFPESVYSRASASIVGTSTPVYQSAFAAATGAASSNWDFILTRASEQIYGAPTPSFFTDNVFYSVSSIGAQATDAAASRYSDVQSLISELVAGKEPDFTESVYNRMSSAYFTGAPAAASYASGAYGSATSAFAASFTVPPSIEEILSSAQEHINEALAFASNQVYPTETRGQLEQASSSLSSVYAEMSDAASVKIYGSQTGYVEAAQASIAAAAIDAQNAVSLAIWGTETQTGTWAQATKIAEDQLDKAKEAYEASKKTYEEAVYGRKVGVWEEYMGRLEEVREKARAQLEGLGNVVSQKGGDLKEGLESLGSVVGEAVESATERVMRPGKDEL